MSKSIIRSSHKNPCPVCTRTKDSDCSWYPDGHTVMCKTCVDGMGHDESQWHYNGVNELGFQGKFVLKTEPAFVKPPRPKSRKEYYYPDRDGRSLVKVTRIDDGEGNKGFPQSHWDGGKWVSGNPDEIKQLVPIYRYVEVRAAISRNELIFVVEGEATADVLWKLGIPATTTIGGSGSYGNYGSYLDDLKGARLVLCPDRDANGLKYMSNFERDFEGQIEGWYLAGTAGLWKNPQGGMDIHDDIRDYDYSKEQIIDRIISPAEYQQIFANEFIEAQLLELLDADLLVADGNKPQFITSWEDGLNWETTESTAKGDIKRVRKFLGNHIQAIAYVENPEGGGTGVLLEFQTRRKLARRLLIPHISLVGDGLEALRTLTDRGYYYIRKQKNLLLDYLFSLGEEVERVYTIADKTGWVNGSFLTPAKTYGDPNLRFREPEPDNSMTEIKGTLDGWKSEVAAKCAGNSRLLFSLGTAFASPLLPLAQIESGGFHLVGTTSIGKTTALNVAASVAGLKTIPSWRSTANALEGKAAEFNHLLLPLDEIYQADPQTVGASAYMLGNGQGKNRMSKTLSTVKPKTWELLFLSTGEVSMTDYLRQAKTPAKGGMEARMPSIPADAGKGYGAFEDLHGYQSSVEFVAALETSIRIHQGTAQDAYLTKLVEARKAEGFDKQLRERVQAIAGKLSQQFQDTAISRVAIRFALVQVGLELAHSFNLLPLAIEQCGWAVKQMFDAWVNIRGGAGSIEIKEACNRIEHLFVSNQHNGDRIADATSPQGTRNLLAYRSNDLVTDGVEFWVPTAVFNKEIADGVDKSALIKELQQRGWLKPSLEKDHPNPKRTIAGKRERIFVFSQFWGKESEDENGKPVFSLGHLGHLGQDSETVDQKEFFVPQPCPNDKNGSGASGAPELSGAPDAPSAPDEKEGLGHHWGSLGHSGEAGLKPSAPGAPGAPAKNHDSENTSEKTERGCGDFKVGDRVKPADPYHERGQDTGLVEAIEGEQYVVQWQRDRNVRRYNRDELAGAA